MEILHIVKIRLQFDKNGKACLYIPCYIYFTGDHAQDMVEKMTSFWLVKHEYKCLIFFMTDYINVI